MGGAPGNMGGMYAPWAQKSWSARSFASRGPRSRAGADRRRWWPRRHRRTWDARGGMGAHRATRCPQDDRGGSPPRQHAHRPRYRLPDIGKKSSTDDQRVTAIAAWERCAVGPPLLPLRRRRFRSGRQGAPSWCLDAPARVRTKPTAELLVPPWGVCGRLRPIRDVINRALPERRQMSHERTMKRRGQGERHPLPTPRRKWMAQLDLGRSDGKRVRRSLYAPTRREQESAQAGLPRTLRPPQRAMGRSPGGFNSNRRHHDAVPPVVDVAYALCRGRPERVYRWPAATVRSEVGRFGGPAHPRGPMHRPHWQWLHRP